MRVKLQRFVVSAASLVILTAVVFVVFLSHKPASPSGGPVRPANDYDPGLRAKEAQFADLADEYRADSSRQETSNQFEKRVGNKYRERFRQILGEENSPEELVLLGLWAFRQPTFWGDGIYDGLFFGSIAQLGQMKGERARKALAAIRQRVEEDGKFDAHIAEAIISAEKEQERQAVAH